MTSALGLRPHAEKNKKRPGEKKPLPTEFTQHAEHAAFPRIPGPVLSSASFARLVTLWYDDKAVRHRGNTFKVGSHNLAFLLLSNCLLHHQRRVRCPLLKMPRFKLVAVTERSRSLHDGKGPDIPLDCDHPTMIGRWAAHYTTLHASHALQSPPAQHTL